MDDEKKLILERVAELNELRAKLEIAVKYIKNSDCGTSSVRFEGATGAFYSVEHHPGCQKCKTLKELGAQVEPQPENKP